MAREEEDVRIFSSCDRQRPKVVKTNEYSRAVGQGNGEYRTANWLTRDVSCLTLEAAPYPPSSAGFHTYPPIEALKNFECACDTEVTKGIGVVCAHDPRFGQERHINTDGTIKEGSASAAVVAVRRRGDGDRFPDE